MPSDSMLAKREPIPTAWISASTTNRSVRATGAAATNPLQGSLRIASYSCAAHPLPTRRINDIQIRVPMN